MSSRPRISLAKVLLIAAALAISSLYWHDQETIPGSKREPPLTTSTNSDHVLMQAYAQRQSEVWLDLQGNVSKLLKDDLTGSRHQRFIVKLANQHTVLVAHNIDLAKRIPLRVGQPIQIRGRYEWNRKGGVVHWTHLDPKNRHPGGWIKYQDVIYR